VVGIDVSETMLGRAVRDTRAAGLDDRTAFVRGDATAIPFRDQSFDAVCCFAALHLFADPLRALDRMSAVLTSGGRIAIFTSVRGRSTPLRMVESIMQARSGMLMFEQRDVVEALEDRGFVDVRQRLAGFTQFVGGRLAS
jgi:ubiquinone/menaquinone biosynthesis C-methylase UbiE